MMQKVVPLDVVGSTKFERYKKQSVEETFNMIISDNALVPYSGYKSVLTIDPSGEARALYQSSKFNKLTTVIGKDVYTVDDGFAVDKIGQLDTEIGDVFMAENNANEIAIVDGLNIYLFNYFNTNFSKIVVDFSPVYIDFQDTYFIAADGQSNQWLLSGQNQGDEWVINTSTVGEISTKPDLMVAAVSFNRQLFAIGKKSTEIWHDIGVTDFPYQRDNSLSIDYGCLNAATIAEGFGLLVWLASNEKSGTTIVYSDGGPVKTISTDGINFILDKILDPQNSTGFLFEEDGHVFYQITFQSEKDNISYVYDFNTQKFFTVTDPCGNAHIAKRVVFFNNTHFFVSFLDGDLYEFGTQFTQLNGEECPRVRRTRNLRLPDASRFILQEINLTIEEGAGWEDMLLHNKDDTISAVPRASLSISKNGGQSFGSKEFKDLNRLGVHPNRLRWWHMGSANDAVFQFEFSSHDRVVVIAGSLRYGK